MPTLVPVGIEALQGRLTALLSDEIGYHVFAPARRRQVGDKLREATSTRLKTVLFASLFKLNSSCV
jgi:hypothetical protein